MFKGVNSTDCDAVIFLDSDAWIVDGSKTKLIVNNLLNNEKKNGCFSRDPYVKKNTYINSGSFIIKNNTYIKKMYTNILQDLNENDHYHKRWPYDQYYVSKEIVEHREDFVIFVPDILNTPIGKVFRHNWLKNGRMWDQLKREPNLNIIDNPDFVEENYYDNECYPNKKASGYEYFH